MTAKGHFFVVSLKAIQKIVKSGGLAEEVMSYLVLARHTQGRGQWQRLFSTSGAKAIHLKTGIPYRRATRSLHWLEKAGIIIPMNETIRRSSPHLPEHFGKIKTLATTIRWVLHDFSSGVFLAYPEHYPFGIFRLRFRPKVMATGRWLKSETSKVMAWKSLLDNLLE